MPLPTIPRSMRTLLLGLFFGFVLGIVLFQTSAIRVAPSQLKGQSMTSECAACIALCAISPGADCEICKTTCGITSSSSSSSLMTGDAGCLSLAECEATVPQGQCCLLIPLPSQQCYTPGECPVSSDASSESNPPPAEYWQPDCTTDPPSCKTTPSITSFTTQQSCQDAIDAGFCSGEASSASSASTASQPALCCNTQTHQCQPLAPTPAP